MVTADCQTPTRQEVNTRAAGVHSSTDDIVWLHRLVLLVLRVVVLPLRAARCPDYVIS